MAEPLPPFAHALGDGIWCIDPECPDWVPNAHGTLNSVITVD